MNTAKKAQHTGGEWGISPKEDYYIYSKDDDSTIAKVYYGSEANARLIASSPRLLEVLEQMIEYYAPMVINDDNDGENPSRHDELIALALEAIKQARGE
jgi:hypothetical protein